MSSRRAQHGPGEAGQPMVRYGVAFILVLLVLFLAATVAGAETVLGETVSDDPRVRLRAVPPSPQQAGQEVTWAAWYVRDTEDGHYSYEFALRGPATDYEWKVMREFSPEKLWRWNTRGYRGDHLLRVRVRGEGVGVIMEATSAEPYRVDPAGLHPATIIVAVSWCGAIAVVIALQLFVTPRESVHARLRIIEAPQGFPLSELRLPPMEGLRWIHEARVGHARECDLPLGDERLARVQCRVRRWRFGSRLGTSVLIEPGAPVYVDGMPIQPSKHALRHMTRLRMGDFEVRYETGAAPTPVEVICTDGHIVRGSVGRADLFTVPTLVVQPMEAGMSAATVPFPRVEQIRCYRSRAEDERMHHRPGSATVGGPLVRVWFTPQRTLTGRLADAQEAEEGRFRVYVDEVHGLAYILINAAAAQKIKVMPGTERPPTFTPRHERAAARSRLALAGPGPTAVGSKDIEAALERAHERAEHVETEPERAPAPERPPAPAPTAAPTEPPPPSEEEHRYIRRRGKPRI